jgi:hypothetical protein
MSATLENGREVDNSWTVSYTMYLLLKYACHINVVVCTYVNLIKYLYTYNFKGGDRAMAGFAVPGQDGQPAPPQDKIAEFEDLQSGGTTEACWRLYGFETNMIYPTLQRLDAHLEIQHRAVLQRGNGKRVLNEENSGKTDYPYSFL